VKLVPDRPVAIFHTQNV